MFAWRLVFWFSDSSDLYTVRPAPKYHSGCALPLSSTQKGSDPHSGSLDCGWLPWYGCRPLTPPLCKSILSKPALDHLPLRLARISSGQTKCPHDGKRVFGKAAGIGLGLLHRSKPLFMPANGNRLYVADAGMTSLRTVLHHVFEAQPTCAVHHKDRQTPPVPAE